MTLLGGQGGIFKSRGLLRGPYFATRKGAGRVLQFCMGSEVTKILGFQSTAGLKGNRIKILKEVIDSDRPCQ